MSTDLTDKSIDIRSAASKALKDKELLSELLDGLTSKREALRYNCFKVLLLISEEHPGELYTKWGTSS